ncbi:MAG: hypothetical protein C4288_15600 [Leptolyngbya sp. ERB_1_1]
MKSQFFFRSSCSLLFALSLFAGQSSFAQTSLQIHNSDMVIQTGDRTLVLDSSSSPLYPATRTQMISTKSTQRTSVSLNSTALQQPCWLTVSTSNGQLSGQIKIGKRVIQLLKGSRTVVNLTPYLSTGTKTIEISGKYPSVRGSLQIQFSGGGTQVTQQSTGSGSFNHSVIVTVR